MGKQSAPPAPDYAKLIPEQERSNLNQFNTVLSASRPNISTPTGTTSWTRTAGGVNQSAYSSALDAWKAGQGQGASAAPSAPVVNENGSIDYGNFSGPTASAGGAMPTEDQFRSPDSWSMSQQLSPEEQSIFSADQSNRLGMQGKIRDALGSIDTGPLDMASLPPGYSQDPARLQQLADASYNSRMRFLEPQFQQQSRGLREDLMSQGFNSQDLATLTPTGNLQNTQNLARLQAADQAILASGAEDSRLYGQSENTRARRLSEMLTRQNQPLALINGLRTGAMPQTTFGQAQYSAPGLQGVDRIGAANDAYGNELEAANASNANFSRLLGGAASIAAAPATGGSSVFANLLRGLV
jgi:hypothetical protein